MTTTRIILVSFMVNTLKNVTGNSQLPVRIKKSLPRSSAPVTSIGPGARYWCTRLKLTLCLALLKLLQIRSRRYLVKS